MFRRPWQRGGDGRGMGSVRFSTSLTDPLLWLWAMIPDFGGCVQAAQSPSLSLSSGSWIQYFDGHVLVLDCLFTFRPARYHVYIGCVMENRVFCWWKWWATLGDGGDGACGGDGDEVYGGDVNNVDICCVDNNRYTSRYDRHR